MHLQYAHLQINILHWMVSNNCNNCDQSCDELWQFCIALSVLLFSFEFRTQKN